MPLHHDFLHRVPVKRTGHLGLVAALLVEINGEDSGKLKGVALAGVEVQLDGLTINSVEQRLNIVRADAIARKPEAHRVNAPADDVARLGIGRLGVIGYDVLAYIPAVAGLLVATNVWELARKGVWRIKFQHVLLAVERRDVKAFVRPPNQAFVEVSALQVDLYLVKPLLACRRFELAEEFFFTV